MGKGFQRFAMAALLCVAATLLLPARLLALDLRVVYVSHDLAEIWRLPAEVIVLENGHVTASGPLRQVLGPQRDRMLQLLSL